MARSIATIKQQIIETKNAELPQLNSTSQAAIWNLWAFITAVAINLHEQILDIMKGEIEDLASKIVPGTQRWLRNKVLQFQYGDILSLNENLIPGYSSSNELAQIVKQCSIKQETDRSVIIKVAREHNGELVPLGFPYPSGQNPDNNVELSALKTYVDEIKFAGTSVKVITRYPDKLQVYGTVYFDGQYIGSTVKDNVIIAIEEYLRSLPFDGVLLNTKLTDAIQAVPGVIDVKLDAVKTREHFVPPTYATVVPRIYASVAGYIVPEVETGYKLDTTIQIERYV